MELIHRKTYCYYNYIIETAVVSVLFSEFQEHGETSLG